MIRSIALMLMAVATVPVSSETVSVKDGGTVDVGPFGCTDTPRSSIIQRVCYDKMTNYLVINVRGTYHHFCAVPPGMFEGLLTASSMGKFYGQKIKSSGSGTSFDCGTRNLPASE